MDLLMSKLTVPDAGDVIFRHRLQGLMKTISAKKLSVIAAGPGYGKTCFAAQAVTHLDWMTVWYRLDHTDQDPIRFFRYIQSGIQRYYPSFCKGLQWHHKDIEHMAEAFGLEWEKHVIQDLFIVLDDYHLLEETKIIARFLQILLNRLVPHFHLVIISRSNPDFKLSRLLAGRQAVCLSEADLRFTKDEIKRLYTQVFDFPVTDTEAALLEQKSEGWIAGLIFFYDLLVSTTDTTMTDAILQIKGSHRIISRYLEENIFDTLSDDIKAFVLKTSILSQLDVGFCSRFLETDKARRILCTLEENHCFTFPVDEDRKMFFFQHLFQDYLKDKLSVVFSAKDITRLYHSAALTYEKNDDNQEALKHHILAGNIEDAARLLNELARPLIKLGRPQIVKSLLSSIPEHYMDDEPWFQYLEAGYFGLCSQFQLAMKGYEKVLKIFRRKKDEEGECLCRMELAEYHMSAGDLKRSELEYRKILNKNKLDPYLTIIVMGYLIRVLTLLRRTGEADKFANQAIELLSELKDEASLTIGRGWIYTAQGFRFAFSGSYPAAMDLGEKSKTLFEAAGQYRLMFASYYLISYSCFYLGLFSKGVASAREGIQIELEKGVFDEYSEFLRLLHARNCLEQENLTDQEVKTAVSDCRKSLELFQEHAFPAGIAQSYLVLHKALLKSGNVDGAELSLRNGIKILDQHDMPLIKNELKVALAELLFFERDKDQNIEAMSLLKNTEETLLYSGWHNCWISRIYARYYWEFGHRETTYKYIVYSLKISEEEGFDTWMLQEKDWIIPLLVELYAMESMAPYLKKIFSRLGEEARADLIRMTGHAKAAVREAAAQLLSMLPRVKPPAITACLFGRFSVRIGQEKIPESRWKSKKARTLFKYLLCMRHKGYLDKDILMELLWPDEDPKKSAQRFHVALAALRRTLEPDISKGVKSAYIKRSGTGYWIDVGEGGQVDVEAFHKAFKDGEQARTPADAADCYKQAQSVYRGDFLEEDPYEEWCSEERERFRRLYLSALKKMIAYHESQQEYAVCIRYAHKYLTIDPYEETLVRDLMRYYASSGNKPMAARIYERFKSSIKKELDCGLSDETTHLYTRLLSP